MSAIDKVVIALRDRGPMTAIQLAEHLKDKNIHPLLSYHTEKGALTKTGERREAVYAAADPSVAPPQPQQKKSRKSAAGRKKARKAGRPRKAKRAPKTARRPNGAEAPTAQPFLAALTSERCIALIRNGQVDILSHENTIALADLVLAHFEP